VITSAYANSGNCNGARYCIGAISASWLYFGGRLIGVNGLPVVTDRLGSVRSGISYYPWGEEKTSPPTQDGQVKFGTYFRDMPGQDYADQRYYNANAGRFYTPDPAGKRRVDPKNPTSWNMYAYAGDDPVNRFDPSGLDYCDPEFGCDFNDPLGFDESSAPTGQVGPVYYGDCAVLAVGEVPDVPCIYDGMGAFVPAAAAAAQAAAVPLVPTFFKFVGATSAKGFNYATECSGAPYGAFATETYQVLDQNHNPLPLAGLTVQEMITNPITWIGFTPYPGNPSPGWVPTTRPGPATTNSTGQFIDSPFGGCSSGPGRETLNQQYQVTYNGQAYDLSPILNVGMQLGPGSLAVVTQSYSFSVGR
jgi:RHS repeat-associated protein